MKKKLNTVTSKALAVFALTSISLVFAEDNTVPVEAQQSVSTSNYKAGILAGGGAGGTEGSIAATALYATQIGKNNNYGLQLEGHVGGTNNHAILDFTGQVFKRDPTYGLLGVYGSANYGRINYGSGTKESSMGQGIGRLGIEGARYLDNFTIGGVLGAERDYQAEETGFFDKIGIDYFFTPNFKGSAFHQYTGKRHGGGLGFELLANPTSETPISIYGEVMDGKDSVVTYNIGARVLFGANSNRSLQTRDRYDYVHNINPRPLARKVNKSGSDIDCFALPSVQAEQTACVGAGGTFGVLPGPSCDTTCSII